jgi:CelD/BcsL family acetyltransferase involved in cellulose biosynthesis
VLSAGGETVGVATGIRSDRAYFVHDLLFKSALKRFSPGTTLWQVLVRHLIEQGSVSRVGVSYGSPSYRFREVNHIDEKGRVLLYRRTLTNQVIIRAHAVHSALIARAKIIASRFSRLAGPRAIRSVF